MAYSDSSSTENVMADADVVVRLSGAEALVLFEWLARLDSSDSLPVEDPAEARVLWAVHGQLEQSLVGPLQPNYGELLAEARRTVRGTENDGL